MGKKDVIIKRIVDFVNQTAPNSEIYLYGSRARGTTKKLSDWDVLILLNNQNISFAFETNLMDIFYDVEIETGEIISPLIYTKNDWLSNHTATTLFSKINNEGIRLQ